MIMNPYCINQFLLSTGYFAATLLLEVGWLQRAFHYTAVRVRRGIARLGQLRRGRQGYEQTDSGPDAESTEDEDVREERLAVQAGTAVAEPGLGFVRCTLQTGNHKYIRVHRKMCCLLALSWCP